MFIILFIKKQTQQKHVNNTIHYMKLKLINKCI